MASGDCPAGEATGADVRTFLIADVRGYTRYTQEHGDEAAARLAAKFAVLARAAIEGRGGMLLELRGDEALGVFASAREALRAAVELQRVVRERADGQPALPLGVGIGLDAGEAVQVEGGYRGGALNLAARLCSLASPGEILASETIVSLARRVDGIRFKERGLERIKGLESPVRVTEVVSETPLAPVPVSRFASLRRFRRKHVTRRKAWSAAGVAVVGATAAVIAVVVVGGTSEADAAPKRVALAGNFHAADPGPTLSLVRDGFARAAEAYGLETEIVAFDELDDSPATLDAVRARLEDGAFDLVLWAGPSPVAIALLGEVPKYPDTQFVYLDAFLEGSGLEGAPNATAFLFDDAGAGYLAGYLAALMSETGEISVVGGIEDTGPLPARFEAGAKKAGPSVDVRIDYSGSFDDQPACERLANRQIDAGSDVVFAAAGQCGLGALSAAGIRGVWGVGVDRDQSYLGPHVLASVAKRFDRAVETIVRQFLEGTLPTGETVELGLTQEAVDLVGVNAAVPADIRKKLARQIALVRRDEAKPSP